METIKCRKCGHEHKSKFCPNCGSPAIVQVQAKKQLSNGAVIAIVLLSIIGFVALYIGLYTYSTSQQEDVTVSNDNISSSQEEPQITYIEVTAQKLWNDYEDNEIAADEKYTGEYIKITGIVSDINSKDILTSANVLLRVEDSLFGCVQCNFNSEESKVLANIKKGQKITITGICGGLELYNVVVGNCEVQ